MLTSCYVINPILILLSNKTFDSIAINMGPGDISGTIKPSLRPMRTLKNMNLHQKSESDRSYYELSDQASVFSIKDK